MIIYKASDIINRAMQLADLENSDFISWSEKIIALNEKYLQIYQKAIDYDEQNFIRYINTNAKSLTLPCDFFQIRAITQQNGNAIKRRAPTESVNGQSYEILNNTLVLHNCGQVCIEYFPKPKTITLPNKTKELNAFYLDARKNYFLQKDAENNLIFIDRSFEYPMKIESEIDLSTLICHISDNFIAFLDEAKNYLYNIETQELTETGNRVIEIDSLLYEVTAEGDIIDIKSKTIAIKNLKIELPAKSFLLLSSEKNAVQFINWNGENSLNESIVKRFSVFENKIYLCYGNNIYSCFNFHGNEIFTDRKDFVVTNKIIESYNTGRGLLCTKYKKSFLVSDLKDTELNFPNNAYYNYISYILALDFKAKQGGDLTALTQMVQRESEAFSCSITRDAFGVSRIVNVY